jgi:hypothetical protein
MSYSGPAPGRQRGLRHPDGALADQPPRRLQPGAQHGVRRAAEAHPRLGRRGQHLAPRRGVQGQWLFNPDTFTQRHCLAGHLGMRGRDGEVDHQFHVRVPDGLRGAADTGHPVLVGLGLGPVQIEIRAEQHAQIGERR